MISLANDIKFNSFKPPSKIEMHNESKMYQIDETLEMSIQRALTLKNLIVLCQDSPDNEAFQKLDQAYEDILESNNYFLGAVFISPNGNKYV